MLQKKIVLYAHLDMSMIQPNSLVSHLQPQQIQLLARAQAQAQVQAPVPALALALQPQRPLTLQQQPIQQHGL